MYKRQDYIKAIETLQNLPINSPVEYTIPSSPFYPELEEQLEPIWEYKPELLTFHFGIPAKHIIEKAHLFGMLVGVTATCLREAQAIESSGVDFIVAQGIEAGGHRGTFEVSGKNDAKLNLGVSIFSKRKYNNRVQLHFFLIRKSIMLQIYPFEAI